MERERRRRDLHDVASAVRVEEIGTPEVVKERLAVVAVANDTVYRSRSGILHSPSNLPATTAQFGVLAHSVRIIRRTALSAQLVRRLSAEAA